MVEAKTGWQAVKLVREQLFELVVTDVRMRELDGVETFREIRELQPQMPAILMTGFATETLVGSALTEGAGPAASGAPQAPARGRLRAVVL